MGEVVTMKGLFDRSNYLPSEFERKQRTQSFLLSLLIIVFFAVSSFVFFYTLYSFADIIGSIVSASPDVAIRDLIRNVPQFLLIFMTFWTLLLLHAAFRKVEGKWEKSVMKDAICIIAFGAVNVLYIIIMRIAGTYLSLVEGSPTALYPLDMMIYSILFIALGVCAILYMKKWQQKWPLVTPSRGPIVKKLRGLYCTFVAFWTLFALYGLSGGTLTIFIYDFGSGHDFYGVMLVLAFLMSAVTIGFWEFGYNELKEEKKKELLLPLASISLALSVVIAALYFLSLGLDLDAPSNAGFGMLPVAFAASVNIATLLAVLTPVIVSVVALVKGLIARKK